ncbi:DMT family transporter [Streptomyces sp. DSM 42041]|uniref:DMT family transporter n=1 Tax=Streptomyces hazeniae TaxID=3075538 RepID=A0ABU2NWU6_9ACTN|nr:DMT family transporter [Streptomyces sp. DSM 42041]MDT0381455.1 DMT family transporter [Streptomyces sp. DSM 42041]
MNALAASVLLALLSAVAYAGAAIVQERIASTTDPSRFALLRNGRWWVSVVLNGTGALLHVAALGLGPLTVVQPLGVLTIVIVAPLAALTVKRRVGRRAWRGIGLVTLGLAAVLLFTGANASEPLGTGGQYAVTGVATAGVLLLVGCATVLSRTGRTGLRSIALATAAGVAFGTASVCVKAVAEGWALTSPARAVPVLGLIAVFAVTGLATSQAAYRGGGLATPLATATVVNPVVAGAVGILLLDEGFRYGAPGAVAALLGAVVTGWGLFVLTADNVARQRRAAAAARAVVIPAPVARPEAAGVLVPLTAALDPAAVRGEGRADGTAVPLPAHCRS